MKNQINSIESILANFGLQVDDFFVVTFWKTSGEISVQSHFSVEMFNKCQMLLNKDFIYTYNNNIHQYFSQENNLRIALS
jgi:hypothetical protein